MLKAALIFSCGVAVGAVAMFFSLRDRYQDEINKETEELRAYYKNKHNDISKETEDVGDEEQNLPKETADYMDSDKRKEMEEAYERLRQVEHPEEDEPEQDKAYFEGEALSKEAQRNSKPRIIKKDSFDEYPHHDKQTLFYYTEDDTLTTEEDQIVDDVEGLIGDALTKYGFKNNNDEFVYVRNCGINTDFEIEKIFGSFSRMYL